MSFINVYDKIDLMFEWKIQKGWEEYRRDFGLGRVAITTCFLNTFLFAIGSFAFGGLVIEALFPVIVSLIFFQVRERITQLRPHQIFIANIIPVGITIVLNYYIVGLYDQIGHLERYDSFFHMTDLKIFKLPIAFAISEFYDFLGPLKWIYYDLLQIAYMTYYLFPILGGYFYYQQLAKNHKFKIARFIGSVVIFFNLNYLLYLIIPVTGPQYFVEELQALDLPLSFLGQWLNNLIYEGHPNFIDCFPSGHTGISILITIWMFKIKNHYRYLFLLVTIFMIQATVALKYHYLLDVACAIPFAYLCYKLAYLLIPIDVDVRKNRKWRY